MQDIQEKFGLLLYPKAEQDMEKIFEYIYNDLSAPQAASVLINKFYAALDNVRTFPESCALVSNQAIKDQSIRKLIVDKYIIFYKPNTITLTIEVVRVVYGMMNLVDVL